MKNLLLFTVCCMLTALQPAFSQTKEQATIPPETKPPVFGISFTGWVNTDLIYDTRQTVMARDGDWIFYPENVKKDADGKDLNAKGTFTILSIFTRITGNITGPDFLKAKTSGAIEGEFYGNAPANINSFRLRHAYVKLSWPKTELMVGQYWHPMFVVACFPETVSINAGSPFVIFSRNPQVRLSRQAGHFRLSLAAISQLDHPSNGPEGASTKYLRNSILPEMNFLVQYNIKNEKQKTEFLAGASLDLLVLTPRITSEVVKKVAYDTVINHTVVHHDAVTASYKTDARTTSLTACVFAKWQTPKVTIKAGGVYGGNCYALNMLGGYAVKSLVDTARGIVDYATVRTLSAWSDFKITFGRWSPGIFGGFSKNMGASTEVTGPYYSRGANIGYLYRIAPRLAFLVNKVKIAGELDYIVAAYGTTCKKGTVSNTKEVGNLRVLLGVYYYF